MSLRKHSTLSMNETSYIKPRSSEGTRRKKMYFEETATTSKYELNKRKKQLIDEGKCTEIQRENRILLSKITGIMGKPKRQFLSTAKPEQKRSLNSGYKKKLWQQIEIDNAKILQRIMAQKSFYQFGKKPAQVIKRIKVRKTPKIQRLQSAGFVNPERAVRMSRIMCLDGTNLLIQITLSHQMLKIQGRINNGQIKIIQIPRQQALDFIALQCNSNIQNLFDRLSYRDGTLYLIGKDDCLDSEEERNQMIEKEYRTDNMYDKREMESKEYGVQQSSQLPEINVDDEIGFIENEHQMEESENHHMIS